MRQLVRWFIVCASRERFLNSEQLPEVGNRREHSFRRSKLMRDQTGLAWVGSDQSVNPIGAIAMSEEKPFVYVVDDDSSMRESLRNLIRSTGRNVMTFGSAQ